jgi:hypothetical protein
MNSKWLLVASMMALTSPVLADGVGADSTEGANRVAPTGRSLEKEVIEYRNGDSPHRSISGRDQDSDGDGVADPAITRAKGGKALADVVDGSYDSARTPSPDGAKASAGDPIPGIDITAKPDLKE